MSKALKPSGYINIDLGELELGSPVTITDFTTSDDLKALKEYIDRTVANKRKNGNVLNFIPPCPLLVTVSDTDGGYSFSGFAVVSSYDGYLTWVIMQPTSNIIVLEYNISASSLEITNSVI